MVLRNISDTVNSALCVCELVPDAMGKCHISGRNYTANWPRGVCSEELTKELIAFGVQYGENVFDREGRVPELIIVSRIKGKTKVVSYNN